MIHIFGAKMAEPTRASTKQAAAGTHSPRHVGILACSSEGAALCYRTVCSEAAHALGHHAHPECSLHTHSLAQYVACIDRNDWSGVADLMLSSAEKLCRIGAEILICPDNTIHQALHFIGPQLSALPARFIHIAEVVAEAAAERGYKRLILLGTRWLVDSTVYDDALRARGIACVRPTDADKIAVSDIIMNTLVCGHDAEVTTRDL
eukprot:m.268142 g.268142  ORF g.268142 m.268142 type:complete len:206 (+) comp34481_c0_seq1:84-701(+)